jgi:hypothetical protein
MNLRAFLARAVGLEKRIPPRQVKVDFSADGLTGTFTLPLKHKPFLVFDGGAIQREGSGEDYTVAFDGFLYSVVFAVNPAAGDVTVVCEVIL